MRSALVSALCASVAVPAPLAGATDASDSREDHAAQRAIDAVLAKQPGGVQVSDNAVAWEGGNVVLVIPSPGQQAAPPGLGAGVRTGTLTTPALRELAEIGQQPAAAAAAASADSCPGGWLSTDYYCFYEHRDFGGRRLQFTGNTQAGDAVQWGFNNSISSWVSNDVDCTVKAYDPRMPTDLGAYMWRQVEKSQSSYVGNANNDKLSFWNCH